MRIRMMGARLSKHTHHPRQGGINTGTHIQRLHGEPGCIDPDHFRTSRSHSAHSCSAELGQCRITVKAPRRTSIWIAAPSVDGGSDRHRDKALVGAG